MPDTIIASSSYSLGPRTEEVDVPMKKKKLHERYEDKILIHEYGTQKQPRTNMKGFMRQKNLIGSQDNKNISPNPRGNAINAAKVYKNAGKIRKNPPVYPTQGYLGASNNSHQPHRSIEKYSRKRTVEPPKPMQYSTINHMAATRRTI